LPRRNCATSAAANVLAEGRSRADAMEHTDQACAAISRSGLLSA
jgi:hypothetical protein